MKNYELKLSGKIQLALTSSTFSGLVARNINIGKRRTSVRLEPEMWEALEFISKKESISPRDLYEAIYDIKSAETSLSSAIRSFLVTYFKETALSSAISRKPFEETSAVINNPHMNGG